MIPEKKIPEAILRHAKGLAILSVVKVGMMVTYKIGTGLVIARREDGTWSPPSAISSFGVGWGAQVSVPPSFIYFFITLEEYLLSILSFLIFATQVMRKPSFY